VPRAMSPDTTTTGLGLAVGRVPDQAQLTQHGSGADQRIPPATTGDAVRPIPIAVAEQVANVGVEGGDGHQPEAIRPLRIPDCAKSP
jgi:hypothetical protein